jgi:hypothetical protein
MPVATRFEQHAKAGAQQDHPNPSTDLRGSISHRRDGLSIEAKQ